MYDLAIVGGGIVGLATGREMLLRYPGTRLLILEKEEQLGAHQTGRNSGVIHSGIYYKPGSLKARLCTHGRALLTAYCDEHGIEYRPVGKLIVATHEHELPRLDELFQRGQINGIAGLELLNAAQIREREPHCRGIKAIYSPVTGIVDYSAVARSIAAEITSMGGELLTSREVRSIRQRSDAALLISNKGEYEARHIITCGGLYADRLAKMTGATSDPKIVPFRGDYRILKPEKRHLVRGNIYPVPDPNFPFLGVHFTPRMNGDIWLGPNAVLAFAREGYTFATVNAADMAETLSYSGFTRLAARHFRTGVAEMFRDLVPKAYVHALQRYIPELQVEDTLPGPSGVRAQAMTADGTQIDDFVFHGDARALHVRNAPSPAATSSLAIAKFICDDAAQRFSLSLTA